MPAAAWRRRRSADVLKLLALAPGHRLQREQMMDTLWPELSPEAAGANLRKATHYLRRALGTPEPVVIRGGVVALCPDWPVTTDVEEFEAAAREAIGSGAHACEAVAALYRGELLPDDRYASWTFESRERLRLRHIEVLKLGERWQTVLEVDPTDEGAHRALMQAHVDAGNRAAALRQFERLREALRADLGVGPDVKSVELYERILAMDGAATPTMAERASALLAWGLVHSNRMEFDDARRCAQEARALAVEAGLGRELGEASGLLGMVAHAQGAWRDLFRSEFEESISARPTLAPFVLDAHLCLAEFSLYGPTGPDESEAFAHSLLAIANHADSVRGQALAYLMIGEVELLTGRPAEAASSLSRAIDLHEAAQAPSGLTLALIRLAETEILQGRRWRASRLLARALRLAATTAIAPHLVIRALEVQVLAARTPAAASAAVDAGEASLASSHPCQPCSIGFYVLASMTRARAGNLSAGRSHLERAERIAGMWHGGPWEAAVWEARGTLRIAEGDQQQGIALLREAAGRFARAGRPLDAARCHTTAA